MQTEVGAVLKGRVTGITNFGAFVELEDGKTGMVHISEVAATYVKEIREYVSLAQEVTVKVLAISDNGKINLSIKQANTQKSTEGCSTRASSTPGSPSFDDMLSRFMQSSDEKMTDLRRSTGERRVSRKGNNR